MLALRQYFTWALVLSVSLSIGGAAFAQEADTDTAKAILDKGIQLFKDLEFRDAKAELLNVDRDKLDEEDQELLDEYLVKVDEAIRAQMADQEAFNNAEKALKDGNWDEAREGYAQAADSEYLPEPMRKDARAQLALVDERAKAAGAATADEDEDEGGEDEDEEETGSVAAGDETTDESAVTANSEEPAANIASDTETVTASSSDILTRAEERRRIRLQQVRVEFTKAMTQADEFLNAPDASAASFNSARDAVRAASNVVESERTVIPDDQYRTFRQEIATMTDAINDRDTAWQEAQVRIQTKDIDDRIRTAERARSKARQEDIANRVQQAKLMIKQYDIEGAYQTAEGILRIDPNNSWALDNRDTLQTLYFLSLEKRHHDTLLREEHRGMVALREAEIPWDMVLRYPDSWMDLTASRKRFRPEVANDSPENVITRQLLERKITSVDFQEQPLENVIKWLRDVMQADLTVNWVELESAGIGKDTTVTLHLRDKKFETVLKQLLEMAGGATPLGYVLEDGVILISTREGLAKNTLIRTYDINDLLVRVPNFVGPDMNLNMGSDTSSNGTSGSGNAIADPWANNTDNAGEGNIPTKDELTQQIMTMITTSVDPDSWREPWGAGTVGSLTVLPSQGQLVITQTQENHDLIADMLKSLREAQAMEVNIEARFIAVTTGFLESIGLNLDVYFNLGGATIIDPNTGAAIGPSSPQWAGRSGSSRFTPMGARMSDSSFANMLGASGNAAVTSPSLSIGGAFLDDIQVNFLIQATQASSNTRTLVAPRLTQMNGQRSYVSVVTAIPYIGGFDTAVSENTAILTPFIAWQPIGTTLDVESTISADRRYVTMTVRPTVTHLTGWSDMQLPLTSGNVVTSQTIRLPLVAFEAIETTVQVPDRGTLLLGGQRLSTQIQREQGVPLLSKIPVINRFFTNRGMARDEQTLLILIKPTIIINREAEEEAHPGMANMP